PFPPSTGFLSQVVTGRRRAAAHQGGFGHAIELSCQRHALGFRMGRRFVTTGTWNAGIDDNLGSARITTPCREADDSAAMTGLGAANDGGQRTLSVRRNCPGG